MDNVLHYIRKAVILLYIIFATICEMCSVISDNRCICPICVQTVNFWDLMFFALISCDLKTNNLLKNLDN